MFDDIHCLHVIIWYSQVLFILHDFVYSFSSNGTVFVYREIDVLVEVYLLECLRLNSLECDTLHMSLIDKYIMKKWYISY